VAHSFLLEPGRWALSGHWIDQQGQPSAVRGQTLVSWGTDAWFTMVTKLIFPDQDRPDMSFQYRGRMDVADRRYTFVLSHSVHGRVEGEGWIAPDSIVQRYWSLGEGIRSSGFETLYRFDARTYHLSGGVVSGHHLTSTMEAVLERK
jgi:hypothetical protein